jgi:hypothetical protein
MTAVSCTYEQIEAGEGALSDAFVCGLNEQELTHLLVRRFRHYVALGHTPCEALLRAAGFSGADAARIALLSAEPALH